MNDKNRLYQEQLNRYISQHTEAEDVILHELSRETHQKILLPRMLSGHVQGKVLELLSRLTKPKYILEIGTYTGYSAICLAKGMQADGKLHTIEINDEIVYLSKKYFKKAELDEKIQLHIGNAIDIIPTLDVEFDLVFIDGDKRQYTKYYEIVLPRTAKGGLILVDNVLWDGKVIEPDANDDYSNNIREFNKLVQTDSRVRNLLLPLRDGLMIVEKI